MNIYRRGDKFRLTCSYADMVVRLVQVGSNTWILLVEDDYNRWADPVTFEPDEYNGLNRKQLMMLGGSSSGLKLRKIGDSND